MITAFRSQHPQVLQTWEQAAFERAQWTDRLRAEQDRLGRQIYRTFRGLCRFESVTGLQQLPDQVHPAGWVPQGEGLLVPADGPEGDPARAWLSGHQPPPSVEQRLRPFGVAEHHVAYGRIFFPGLERLSDGLYLTWSVDTGWSGGAYFTPVPLSAYRAAHAAG